MAEESRRQQAAARAQESFLKKQIAAEEAGAKIAKDIADILEMRINLLNESGDVQIDGGNLGIGTAPTSRNLSVFRSTAGSVANFLHYTDSSNFSGLYIDVSQDSDIVTINASGSSGAAIDFQTGNNSVLFIER